MLRISTDTTGHGLWWIVAATPFTGPQMTHIRKQFCDAERIYLRRNVFRTAFCDGNGRGERSQLHGSVGRRFALHHLT